MSKHFPEIHDELLDIFDRLEAHYRDMCDTEFTIEQGKLWMLQTRVGKRTGAAALRMAVDMTKGTGTGAQRWKITSDEALMRVAGRAPRPGAAPAVRRQAARCSPRASPPRRAPRSARSYFTADDAADAAERGEKVILVRNETSPEDVHGMMVAEGILTARGGLVSHAAVVARGWGTPAVVGAEAVKIEGKQFTVGDVVVKRGRRHLARRHDRRGRARRDGAARRPSRRPSSTRSSSGPTRSARASSACGPTPTPARTPTNARELGAEGIGLCRTEHMFLAEDRLPVVREMILADTPSGGGGGAREAARASRRPTSRRSSRRWTACPSRCACSTRRCTSSCPSVEELRDQGGHRRASPSEEQRAARTPPRTWAEHNPMLGTRGVRLGVVKPGLYAMQVRALLEAAADAAQGRGKNPIVEIMIPLTVTREEMALARQLGAEAEVDAATQGPEEEARRSRSAR